MKVVLPLIMNVFKPMTKSALTPLELLAEYQQQTLMTGIHKKDFDSGLATLVILNKEIKDIIKIIKSFEESRLLIKDASKTIQNEAKEQEGGCLGMLLGTLSASLIEILFADEGVPSW